MSVLIGIALKSLLIAGLTLGLLQLLKSRSAAERCFISASIPSAAPAMTSDFSAIAISTSIIRPL